MTSLRGSLQFKEATRRVLAATMGRERTSPAIVHRWTLLCVCGFLCRPAPLTAVAFTIVFGMPHTMLVQIFTCLACLMVEKTESQRLGTPGMEQYLSETSIGAIMSKSC